MSMLLCAAVGRVTRDPVLRTSDSGGQWLSVSIRVGDANDATYATIAYFGEAKDKFASMVSRGTWVYVRGRAALRTWDWQGRQYHGLHISSDYLVVLDDFEPPQIKPAERDPELWDARGRHKIQQPDKRRSQEESSDSEPFSDSLDHI